MTGPSPTPSRRAFWLLPLLLALAAASGTAFAPFLLPMDRMHLAWVDMKGGRDRDLWTVHLLYRDLDGEAPNIEDPYLLVAMSAMISLGRHDAFNKLAREVLVAGGGSQLLRGFIQQQISRSDRMRANGGAAGMKIEGYTSTGGMTRAAGAKALPPDAKP